jgi:hypothetical protein
VANVYAWVQTAEQALQAGAGRLASYLYGGALTPEERTAFLAVTYPSLGRGELASLDVLLDLGYEAGQQLQAGTGPNSPADVPVDPSLSPGTFRADVQIQFPPGRSGRAASKNLTVLTPEEYAAEILLSDLEDAALEQLEEEAPQYPGLAAWIEQQGGIEEVAYKVFIGSLFRG